MRRNICEKKIFKQSRKEIFQCFPAIGSFVVLSLLYSVFYGYFSASVFAKLLDSVGHGDGQQTLLLLASFFAVSVLSIVLPIFSNLLYKYAQNRINNATQVDIFDQIQRSRLLSFEDDQWLPQFERVCGLNGVFSDFIRTATIFLAQIVLLFSYFLYLYQYIRSQVYPYLLIVVPALLKSVIFSIYYTKLKRKMNPNLQLERKYLNTLTDPIAQSESKLFHSGKFLYDKWRGQYDKNFKTYLTADKRFVLIDFVCNTVITGLAILTCTRLFTLIKEDLLSVGVAISVISFIGKIILSSDEATQNFGSLILTIGEYRDIKRLFSSSHEDSVQEILQETELLDICVSNLKFHYPNSDRVILDNVSFEIKSGKKVAIVGVNGAGKSTLMKIMAGYYKPVSGTVFYAGQDVQNIRDEDLKRIVSFVHQQPIRYPADFRENILVEDENINEEFIEIIRELDPNFVSLLSQDSLLTPGFSNSRGISGGQWQKIAFLRSIGRKSKIYFFDEPTAALDPISEVKLFELFWKYIQDQTVVLATHRLGLARQADQIIVLDNNSVAGVGTHEELLETCALYRELYRLQAKWYGEEDKTCDTSKQNI